MSRLDRLFTLLSTSTSASARNLAAQQLGEVQKTYPEEFHNLLSRLHPLLRSKRWETRIAAAGAITAILKELPPIKSEEDFNNSNDFDEIFSDVVSREAKKYDIEAIIGNDLCLDAGTKYDSTSCTATSEVQKQRLDSEMGLDVAAKLGIMGSNDLIDENDLKCGPSETSNNASTICDDENLSSREKNVLRRQKRKQIKEQNESAKKSKLEKFIYHVTDEEKQELGQTVWPLQKFCKFLIQDLKSSAWEERHGAATALREVLIYHGKSGGIKTGQSWSEMQLAHIEWLENIATQLLTVLARDRFGDFVSDQVVAPVRESTAMALGHLIKLMPNEDLILAIINVLIVFADHSAWECRHGAFLGLKYLLSVVNLNHETIINVIYPKVFKGIKDVVDDVVSEAASALIPVVKQFVHHIDLVPLSELLWNCLTDLDDLTGSTQSTLKLLSEILKIDNNLMDDKCNSQMALQELIPRLYPFLHHSSSGVRKASLQTLASLVSRPVLASTFLPAICGILMSHLFERCILEGSEDNLKLIEESWNYICDNCPLDALLTATCPLYGQWLVLISKPHMWPLPNELLLKTKKDEQNYLGGTKAQQANNELERNILATRARCQGAKLLGKLAGFIVQPVPGFDYTNQPFTPVQMFTQKILLAHLTNSAFQCTTVSLLLIEWSHFHPNQVQSMNLHEVKSILWKYLCNDTNSNFEEVTLKWQQLQTDTCDLLATLKYHKIMILNETDVIPDKPNANEIQTLIQHSSLEEDCKKNKIKPNRIETLVSRQKDIQHRFLQLDGDMKTLSVMTYAALAGALVSLGQIPEKLNPIIKPLMDSIKKEPLQQYQSLSASKLVLFLDLCLKNKLPNPAEKVTRNLIHFAYGIPEEVIPDNGILSLQWDQIHQDSEDSIQVRGAKMTLKSIVQHFKSDVTSKPPKFFDRVVLPFQQDHLWRGLINQELVQFLNAFNIVSKRFDENLHHELRKTFVCLTSGILTHVNNLPRFLASRCLASLASFMPNETITAVINYVIPMLDNPNVVTRQGATEAMSTIVNKLGLDFVPYIVLFIVPVLGKMSDPDSDVRQLSTSMFANMIKLIPLDSQDNQEEKLPKELLELKLKQKSFIDELMNLKNVREIDLPIKINAELRSYQTDGIKWLSFLNRYKLHGILCDDMGLGKTLQTICMISMDHWQRMHDAKKPACPSLIVCPATLCLHWNSEIKKFVNDLTPFVYNGNQAQRSLLKRQLLYKLQTMTKQCNLAIVTSYEVVRSDLELFKAYHWNYLVLDEGHAIRNAKTKTTIAIKSLQADHRLILSGTPIQNSVLELWSLFDFLMPGFLGSEKQFNTRYTKPIVGSRSDSKSVSKESKEAGVLAMEALHRQVLPFILRRMKEDVLKDLPPKITQDYYCELSSIQKLLYEDFANEQKKKSGGDKTHVFQALQYLRKVCNHPKLVVHQEHKQYDLIQRFLQENHSTLDALQHASKLPALKQLLNECGIGTENTENSVVGQHRALVFCQLKAMMDIVERDLLKSSMSNVTYLRLDGSIPPGDRHAIVTKFNNDVSIDLLLLTTSVGGLGLNLTGADTVIFVEHDWNPMKDLQAMDRAHRIGQKKVVNVYRLITRNTVEEKILGLQKFKLKTANSVITRDNSSLSSMATDQLLDLFSLDESAEVLDNDDEDDDSAKGKSSMKTILENLPELWDDSQYTSEYDLEAYGSSSSGAK